MKYWKYLLYVGTLQIYAVQFDGLDRVIGAQGGITPADATGERLAEERFRNFQGDAEYVINNLTGFQPYDFWRKNPIGEETWLEVWWGNIDARLFNQYRQAVHEGGQNSDQAKLYKRLRDKFRQRRIKEMTEVRELNRAMQKAFDRTVKGF